MGLNHVIWMGLPVPLRRRRPDQGSATTHGLTDLDLVRMTYPQLSTDGAPDGIEIIHLGG